MLGFRQLQNHLNPFYFTHLSTHLYEANLQKKIELSCTTLQFLENAFKESKYSQMEPFVNIET